MRAFNLKQALAGAPLYFEDGCKARLVSHLPSAQAWNRLVVVEDVPGGQVHLFSEEGIASKRVGSGPCEGMDGLRFHRTRLMLGDQQTLKISAKEGDYYTITGDMGGQDRTSALNIPECLGLTWEQTKLRWLDGTPTEMWDAPQGKWVLLNPLTHTGFRDFIWPKDRLFRIPGAQCWGLNDVPIGCQIRARVAPCLYLLITGAGISTMTGEVVVYGDRLELPVSIAKEKWEWRIDAAHPWKPCAM